METLDTVINGGETATSRAERAKNWAVWILLLLPLLAHPLFWGQLFYTRLGNSGLVTFVTLPVMALAAVAVLLLTGFKDLCRFRHSDFDPGRHTGGLHHRGSGHCCVRPLLHHRKGDGSDEGMKNEE